MEVELATWHFAIAAIAFALLGFAAHIIRAVFNLFPDKISDTAGVNILVSDGYSWADHLFGTEYDDAGYYKLDSVKNLKLSVVFWVVGGIGVMMFSPGVAEAIAQLIESSSGFLVDLFWQRIDEVRGIETAMLAGPICLKYVPKSGYRFWEKTCGKAKVLCAARFSFDPIAFP